MRVLFGCAFLAVVSACSAPEDGRDRGASSSSSSGAGATSSGGGGGISSSSASGASASSGSGGTLPGAVALLQEDDAPGTTLATVDLATGSTTALANIGALTIVNEAVAYLPATQEWIVQGSHDSERGEVMLLTLNGNTGVFTREVTPQRTYTSLAVRGSDVLVGVSSEGRGVWAVSPVEGTETLIAELPDDVGLLGGGEAAIDRTRDVLYLGFTGSRVDNGAGRGLAAVNLATGTTSITMLQPPLDETFRKPLLRPDGTVLALTSGEGAWALASLDLDTGTATTVSTLDLEVMQFGGTDVHEQPLVVIHALRGGREASDGYLLTVSTQSGLTLHDVPFAPNVRALALR